MHKRIPQPIPSVSIEIIALSTIKGMLDLGRGTMADHCTIDYSVHTTHLSDDELFKTLAFIPHLLDTMHARVGVDLPKGSLTRQTEGVLSIVKHSYLSTVLAIQSNLRLIQTALDKEVLRRIGDYDLMAYVTAGEGEVW